MNQYRLNTNCGEQNRGLIQLVKNSTQLQKIWHFRAREYQRLYPAIAEFEHDPFDDYADIFFTEDGDGEITSTARLAWESKYGLPDESLINDFIASHRKRGLKLLELGRFIIADDARGALKGYYRHFYQSARKRGIDSIVMVMRENHIKFHQRLMGATVLCADLQENFGSNFKYACVEWKIAETKTRFFDWCGLGATLNDDDVLMNVA
jgi:hypothetical protein